MTWKLIINILWIHLQCNILFRFLYRITNLITEQTQQVDRTEQSHIQISPKISPLLLLLFPPLTLYNSWLLGQPVLNLGEESVPPLDVGGHFVQPLLNSVHRAAQLCPMPVQKRLQPLVLGLRGHLLGEASHHLLGVGDKGVAEELADGIVVVLQPGEDESAAACRLVFAHRRVNRPLVLAPANS